MSEAKLDRIITEVGAHGKILARLDERSTNQKDRLDRIEKKTTIISAITGAVSGIGVMITKAFGFDG